MHVSHLGGPFPDPDATEEFTVVSGNYGSRYVSAPGGAVNIITKSGTNAIHGDLFEFLRNGDVNARNFFSAQPDLLKRNQFGATTGAPILHDRWFVFGSYQGTRLSNLQGGLVSFVPTAAERSGDLSAISSPVINPVTGIAFPNNRIPTSSLDPVMQKLLDYIPTPSASNGSIVYGQPISQQDDQYVVKAITSAAISTSSGATSTRPLIGRRPAFPVGTSSQPIAASSTIGTTPLSVTLIRAAISSATFTSRSFAMRAQP